jgi:hypothetical protein
MTSVHFPPPNLQPLPQVTRANVHHRSVSKSAAHDVFKHFQQRPLDSLFRPQSIAVIGASDKEGSVGRTLLWNLMRSPFGGTIYPINVNPRKKNIFGVSLNCYCLLFTVLSVACCIAYSTLYSLRTRSSPTQEYKIYRPVMVKLTWQ